MNHTWQTAVHEATHAIVAHSENVSVGDVSIVPEGLTAGHMRPYFGFQHVDTTKAILILLAGAEGERIICGRATPGGDAKDLEGATALASSDEWIRLGYTVDRVLDLYRTLARAKIVGLRHHIEALARNLQRRKTIP